MHIRNIRRDALEDIKKAQKDTGLSEDDAKKAHDEIQELTDAYMVKVEASQEKGGGDHRDLSLILAEISLPALRQNLKEVARRVGSSIILAVVKANAYGHGAGPRRRHSCRAAPDSGVATIAEGVELGSPVSTPLF